jgi:hypothetical protein
MYTVLWWGNVLEKVHLEDLRTRWKNNSGMYLRSLILRIGSWAYPMLGFHVSSDEPSVSATRVLASSPLV